MWEWDSYLNMMPMLSNVSDILSSHGSEASYCAALKEDGTISILSGNQEGILPEGIIKAEAWTGIEQIAGCISRNQTGIVLGLQEDGTVYATGRNDSGQCEVEDWTDVVYITAGENCTLGIQSDGTLLIAGEI